MTLGPKDLCVTIVASAIIIIVSCASLLSPLMSLIPVINQVSSSLISMPPDSAHGERPQPGIRCNCMIDYTTGGHSNVNTTGITIPGVRLLKHETLLSQTEGGLSWIAIKPTHLMSILMKDFSLGNFSSGTGATVALNTINVSPNESLGVKISGGTLPAAGGVRGEIIKAYVNVNGTLGEIRTLGNKTIQFPLHYSNAIKQPVLGVNKFLVKVKQPGYYLLLISLGYNTKSNNNNINTNDTMSNNKFMGNVQTRYPLIAVYESVSKI